MILEWHILAQSTFFKKKPTDKRRQFNFEINLAFAEYEKASYKVHRGEYERLLSVRLP